MASVAVCFLHAHANSANEREAARLLRELLPRAYVCTSSEVIPQVRFYERTSTTVLNAAVGPILSRYLTNLTARLATARAVPPSGASPALPALSASPASIVR